MDEISISDIQGKALFQRWIKSRGKANKIEFTEDKNDKVDVTITSSTGTAAVELKYRKTFNSKSKVIQSGGTIIQQDKYDYLKRTVTESGYTKAYYLNIYNDGIGYMYDISTLDNLTWHEDKMPHKSEFEVGNKGIITKKVAYLPLSIALKIDFKHI